MATLKWTLVTLLALGALNTVARVGKPREPWTNMDAVVSVVVNAGMIAWILWVMR